MSEKDNTATAAAKAAKAAKPDKKDEHRFKTGVAVGIGSAAIVAALLYASTVKKPKRGGVKKD